MGSGVIIGIIVLVCFFVLAFLIACFQMLNRIAGIEESMEKISILMTVMANKQGATQEDILAATTEETDKKKKK